MIPRCPICALLAPTLVWVVLATPVHGQITGIPTPGGASSEALAISADGETVVGFIETSLQRGFRWNWRGGGATTALGSGLVESRALAVSANGSVVVGYEGEDGMRWVGGDTLGQALGSLPGVTADDIRARGVSADGLIIVGEANNNDLVLGGDVAFAWSGGVMQALGDLDGGSFLSVANAVSADGSVIVGRGTDGLTRATVFDGLPPTAIDASGLASEALGVSGDGEVVVGVRSGRAFISSTTGPITLLDNSIQALALDASFDGSIVVGRMTTSGVTQAMIWDQTNGMRSLQTVAQNAGIDLTGWTLRRANSISDDGRVIVGWGDFDPNGGDPADAIHQGFVLDLGPITPVPEPSSGLLIPAVLVGWLAWRRMNRRRR